MAYPDAMVGYFVRWSDHLCSKLRSLVSCGAQALCRIERPVYHARACIRRDRWRFDFGRSCDLARYHRLGFNFVVDVGGFISRLEVERSHFEQVAQILVSYKGCQDDSNTAYLSNHAHRSIYH